MRFRTLLCGPMLLLLGCATLFAQEKPFVASKRWALVIGAQNYQEYGQLRYAASDAKAVHKALLERFDFEPGTVRLLTDEPGGGGVTHENVSRELDALLADPKLDRSDLFVFFFSGHGVGLPSGDYLLPINATKADAEKVGIPVKSIIERFVRAGLKNVLVISDACRGGEENAFGEELQELGKKANIAVLLGCAPGKRSYENRTFRQGVFAHFLLESFEKSELRNRLSGALWASAVAEDVRRNVLEFTQRDFGEDAQEPAIWSEKTQDVLLAAYLPKSSESGLAAFLDEAQKLEQTQFEAALARYAEALFQAEEYLTAVEALKTLDQIGEMTDHSRYTLGIALDLTDRLSESVRVLEKLAKESESEYIRALAVCSNGSKTVAVEDRLKAIDALWETDSSDGAAMLIWVLVKNNAESETQQLYAKRILESTDSQGRLYAYVKAEADLLSGNYDGAVEGYRKGRRLTKGVVEDYLFQIGEYLVLGALKRYEELEKLFAEAEAAGEHRAFWLLAKARNHKDNDRFDEMLSAVREAMKENPAPNEIIAGIRIAGMRVASIADEVAAASEAHPYSWKAWLAKMIAESAKNGMEKGMDLIRPTEKYAESEVDFVTMAFTIVDEMLNETFTAGAIDGMTYARLQTTFFSLMIEYAPKFGLDAELWERLVTIGLSNERNLQLFLLARDYLTPLEREGKLSSALLSTYMMICIGVGDIEEVERVARSDKFSASDRVDSQWFLAMMWATVGKFHEGYDLINKLAEPSYQLKDHARATRALLEAIAGDKDEARKLLDPEFKDPAQRAFAGIAWHVLEDFDKSFPLLEESRTQRNSNWLPIHSFALGVLFEEVKAAENADACDELAYEASLAHPGNPLFARFHYGVKPDLSIYVGSKTLPAIAVGDQMEPRATTIEWSVSADGSAKGRLGIEEGKSLEFTGTVDDHGNLVATGTWDGSEHRVFAKLPPPDRYGKIERLESLGVVFMAFDKLRVRKTWIARPNLGAPSAPSKTRAAEPPASNKLPPA